MLTQLLESKTDIKNVIFKMQSDWEVTLHVTQLNKIIITSTYYPLIKEQTNQLPRPILVARGWLDATQPLVQTTGDLREWNLSCDIFGGTI